MTISALSIGMFVTVINTTRGSRFIRFIANAAAVPSSVAASADTSAISSVVPKASMISREENRLSYHFRLKPPHFPRKRDSLKESTINVTIGPYKKTKIKNKYTFPHAPAILFPTISPLPPHLYHNGTSQPCSQVRVPSGQGIGPPLHTSYLPS